MYVSKTGSVAQDALLEGYQLTCHSGISNLLKIKDLTIASCQSYIPKAIEEAKKKLEICERTRLEFTEVSKKYSEAKKLHNSFFALFKVNHPKLFPDFREKFSQARRDISRVQSNRSEYFDAKSFYCTEPEIDDINGRVVVDIIKVTYDGKETIFSEVFVSAKSAQVEYVDYNLFTDYLIPDHVTKEIRRALAIGLKNIKIARPVLVDTKIVDPLVIGFIEERKSDQTLSSKMFLITRFGFNKEEDKMLAECSKECSI